MSGKRVGGGDMTGGVLRGGRRHYWGEEAFWRGREFWFQGFFLDFLVLSWSSAVWEDHYGGHRFAGGFGHGGQDSLTVSWS
jgi:hypothetical protein